MERQVVSGGGSWCFGERDKQEVGWHQKTEGLMVSFRVAVAPVIMAQQIAQLAVASLLICVLQETFSVTAGHQLSCSKRSYANTHKAKANCTL